MKKRVLALLLAAVIAAGLFSSCRKSSIKALYFAVEGAAASFDPQIAVPGAVSVVVRNCFEGLVRVSDTGEILPAAAERWEVSADGLTYTFHLRQGAMWHVSDTAKNGLGDKLPEDFAPEVTADDFVFALRRAADPVTGAPQAALLSNIAGAQVVMAGEEPPAALGVRADGKYTLEITLASPEPGFLETLAEPLCMPCNRTFFEATGGRYGLLMKYVISNGPFYLTRFEDNAFRLARDAAYTGPNPAKADVVWLYSGQEQAAVLEKLSAGDYSGALLPEADAAAAQIKRASAVGAGDTLRAFLFNPKNEDLANLTLRKAFFEASDLSVLCEAFGKTPAGGLCPAALTGSVRFASAKNEEAAGRLLSEALEELEKSSVSLTLLCEERYDAALRRFLQDWQKSFGVGCAVALETVTAAELTARVQAGEYDIAFYPVRAPFFAPWAYYRQFSAAFGASLVALEDEEFDAALAALRYATAGGDAQRAVELKLKSEYVLLPVWQEGTTVLCAEGVSGVRLLPGEDRIYFWNADKAD